MSEYTQEYEASQVDPSDSAKTGKEKDQNSKKKKKPKPKEIEMAKTYKHGNADLNRSNIEDPSRNDLESFYESEFDVGKPDEEGGQEEEEVESVDSVITHKPKLNFDEKKAKAYCLGVHLAAIRNFVGANAIITQGGIFISMFNPGLGQWTSLIVNIIQLIAIVFGMTYVQSIMGKKPLFLISIPVLSLLNFALVIAMIYENVPSLLMLMCIFLAVFGTGFINPIWAYPAEVIPAAQQLPANVMHWLSIAIAMLIPPLVASFMPKNNSWPVFVFFGLYSFVGFLHVRSTLKESDGKTYKEIIESFK
jgi:hypothetical protein